MGGQRASQPGPRADTGSRWPGCGGRDRCGPPSCVSEPREHRGSPTSLSSPACATVSDPSVTLRAPGACLRPRPGGCFACGQRWWGHVHHPRSSLFSDPAASPEAGSPRRRPSAPRWLAAPCDRRTLTAEDAERLLRGHGPSARHPDASGPLPGTARPVLLASRRPRPGPDVLPPACLSLWTEHLF